MSDQPTSVDGMIARLRDVWGHDIRIEVHDTEQGWIVEAWRPPIGKIDARSVTRKEET